MFGDGVDAGQTTIRLRHAYGELGNGGAGQTNHAVHGRRRVPQRGRLLGPERHGVLPQPAAALHRGHVDTQHDHRARASGRQRRCGLHPDLGWQRGRQFPVPDLSAEYPHGDQKWGYCQLAGIVRRSSGRTSRGGDRTSRQPTGWGGTLQRRTSTRQDGRAALAQGVYGEGIENYMNDAPIDVARGRTPAISINAVQRRGAAGRRHRAFVDHTWNEKYQQLVRLRANVDIDNSLGQSANAFQMGSTRSPTCIARRFPNCHVRCRSSAGSIARTMLTASVSPPTSVRAHVQVSFKYNFSIASGGGN